ncbi:MAG TPA: type II toxin-antitoxin system HigB family toxin [Bacteroidia bacterium]|nr:type II toxin-antitoxin system HigB family toxin [Bacteroidia bacterium]
MRINLIKKQTIKNYSLRYPNSKNSLEDWLSKVKVANWEKPGDIKSTFNTADFLGKNSHRVVFDIGGNNYRMICKYAFGDNEVHIFVLWIGTHAQYDAICARNEQYTVSIY